MPKIAKKGEPVFKDQWLWGGGTLKKEEKEKEKERKKKGFQFIDLLLLAWRS